MVCPCNPLVVVYRFTNLYYCCIFCGVLLGAFDTFAVPSRANTVRDAAQRLKRYIAAPPLAKPLPASQLTQLEADMNLLRKRLKLYFGPRRKRLSIQQRLELRSEIQAFRAEPNALLLFANDATRFNPKLDQRLATGYEALAQTKRASRHRLAQSLSSAEANVCRQKGHQRRSEQDAPSSAPKGATVPNLKTP